MRAMMDHMRQSEVAVFPPTCVGLCNKVGWCAARTGEAPGPGTDDCEAACAEGGAYAEVPRREHGCALANCEDLAECRQGGAAAPAAP